MRTLRPRLLAACALCALGCASDDDGDACLGSVAAPLFGASTDPLELEAREQNAVVALTRSAAFADGGLCSGVLIAPRRVLTARHCADLLPDDVSIFVGPSVPEHVFQSPVLRFTEHRELDVAVAELEDAVPADLATPLRAIDGEVALELGELATLVGFGLTEDDGLGQRLYVREPIVAIDAEAITVDGGGRTGACVGDSGGPLLVRDGEGHHRVAGVLSKGSASCVDIDVYQRLEPVADWLDPGGC